MNKIIIFVMTTIMFVTLKLIGCISWSWWWVTLPLWWWIPLLIAVGVIGAAVLWILDKNEH